MWQFLYIVPTAEYGELEKFLEFLLWSISQNYTILTTLSYVTNIILPDISWQKCPIRASCAFHSITFFPTHFTQHTLRYLTIDQGPISWCASSDFFQSMRPGRRKKSRTCKANPTFGWVLNSALILTSPVLLSTANLEWPKYLYIL